MKSFSLNKRLVTAIVASQFLLAAALVLVGTSFSRHYIRRAFDVYLEGRAQSIAATVYYSDDGSARLLFNEAKVLPPSDSTHLDIFDVSSAYTDFDRHSSGFDSRYLNRLRPGDRYFDFRVHGEEYRGILLSNVGIQDTEEGVPAPPPTLKVIYAASTAGIDSQTVWLAASIAVVSLIVLIPTLMLALTSLRKALTPLHDLTAAASAISVRSWNFSPTEAAQSTRELKPLIVAITTVLAGLESAFTRQREFLGNAAHELKTSLAILKSTLQTLINKPRSPEEYQSGLAVMSRDCERLERLLNRMLQTARAEQRIAGDQLRRPDPVDLASSCEAAIAHLAQFAAAREIHIDFEANGEAMLRAEMADLELIWINLLENAIQYGPRGSAVSMTLTVRSGRATVAVADSGPGIDPAHLPRIFERFYRADSSRSRSTGGFGLGLAIAKSLVSFYGGRIDAQSTPGKGATITVEFPVEPGPVSGTSVDLKSHNLRPPDVTNSPQTGD